MGLWLQICACTDVLALMHTLTRLLSFLFIPLFFPCFSFESLVHQRALERQERESLERDQFIAKVIGAGATRVHRGEGAEK